MKAAFLCCLLLLAGSASCSPVEANSIGLPEITIPDWIIDLIVQLPDSIQNIIDKLPEIIAAVPEILEKIPEIIAQIIEKIPEVIPIILDKLPEIIAQIPAIIEQIPAIIEQIINKIPELIPIILEKIPEIIAAIPDIIDKIKEILKDIELPDWFPTLPDLDKPEWWPDELPTLPEYNPPVAGTPASVTKFPGIVQIEVGTGPIWAQGCAGSILTSFHVLTVARCFSGKTFSMRFRRVRAGSSTRYTDGSIVEIDRAVNHPDFLDRFSDNDISVIRLSNSLLLSSTIQQTPIVPQDFNLPSGISVVLAGWGSTAQGKRIANRDLHEVDLTVVDGPICADRWSKIPPFIVNPSVLCVGRSETGGRNADVRDIGAPVYYDGILVGIVSVGVPAGNQYFPVLTTDVATYTNWIVANAN